ncbi:MAG TPA: hypothetical protein VJ111_05550 [Chitinophagaceae bacterium]|nr:hypothetical protein [Chitinophagaceae bacterium]
MRKILSERNIVVILFVVALVVFSFAQEDAKKAEKMYLNADAGDLITAPKQTAGNIVGDKPVILTTEIK